MMDKGELQTRIARLQKIMLDNMCEAMLIFQNIDLYYFSGTMQSAYLFIPGEGGTCSFLPEKY